MRRVMKGKLVDTDPLRWQAPLRCIREGCCPEVGVFLHTGTPDADQALFEEILVDCTAFQLAGALTEDSVKEAVNEVAELVLSRAPGTSASSAAAGAVSGSESAPSSQAAQALVSAAVASTGDTKPMLWTAELCSA